MNRKNDKAVKIIIETKYIVKKQLGLRVRVRFIFFYSELAPTDSWSNMLQTLLGRKKYEEVMSNEQPLW